MKKRITFILVMVLFCSFYSKVSASELCSSSGYTVLTINGIFTNEMGAVQNKDKLKDRLLKPHNNQKINVDYLYNPTHLAGVGDFVDAMQQGLFDQKSDYDLVEILNDASRKVTTQKLLLIAHSQGNFYANNFYDKVASKEGGIPRESIGVYGVASPAGWVAGSGKYLTSKSDSLINDVRKMLSYTLKANVDIKLEKDKDGNGHSFSDVYLKYQGDRIVSDIKSSLDRLKENDEQISSEPCISAQELTLGHKIVKGVLAVADPVANIAKKKVTNIYDAGSYLVKGIRNAGLAIGKSLKGLSANVIETLPDSGGMTTVVVDVLDGSAIPKTEAQTESVEDNSLKEPLPNSLPKTEEIIVIPTDASDAPDTSPHARSGGSSGNSSATESESEVTLPPAEDPVLTTPTTDTVLPVVTILGNNPESINVGSTYVDAGANAIDDIDGIREVAVAGIADVNTAVVGVYTITYTSTDLSGNIGTATRIINVVAEVPPPPPPLELETITISENTTLLAGEYNYENLIITNNAVLTLEGNPESVDEFKGVKINAINLTIAEGASISTDQKGYGPNQGPGISSNNSVGASYGGFSLGGSITYGSAIKPMDLGSGGTAPSFSGGGAIHIVVSDTFTNDGTVSSDGGAAASGGSIYVTAKNIKGSGTIHANGGGLYATGYFRSPGSGGRVAIYYQTSSFDGTVEAKGGCGQYDGMIMSCSQRGTVSILDESSNDIYLNNSWRFQKNDSPFNFNHIFLNGAQVEIEDGVEIVADDIILDKASVLVLSGEEIINADNLLLTGNSIITVVPEKILSLIISNITVDAGSIISADEKGYIIGPGTDETFVAGSSYGGKGGGATAKSSYGSDAEPVDFGSGTASHRGGGAIYLEVENNLQNNGIISASGIKERVSGGSVYVRADELSGDGIFQVSGGNSSWPYGPIAGSGGRIAMYYKTLSFSGTTNVLGGVYCFSGCGPAAETGTLVMIDETIVVDPEEPDPEPVPICVSPQILVNNICTDPEPEPTPTCIDPQILVDNICVNPEPDPEPDPEPITTPTITNYSFNGTEEDVTINSLADVTSMVFTANKNVDWVSIKIEKEDDASIFKSLRESADCADGTDTCTKTWNTLLAGDTTAPNGTYKVKIRIRDLSDNTKDYDYFSPYTITVDIRDDISGEI